jgi:hypothetical protein
MTRPHAARAGIVSALWVAMSLLVAAQRQQTPTPTARSVAPIDLTGYWVSVVTTEWRYRMMTPPKGDYEGIPLTPAARKIADTWDPVRDTKAGEQCRAYGAPGVLHLPGRLHITWADDMTLRMEIDQGMQTRLFAFGSSPQSTATRNERVSQRERTRAWQGQSAADWQLTRPATGAGPPSAFPKSSSLKVVTSQLRPGYIRRNGVPYGENALLTEYFDVVPGTRGEQFLIVTTLLDDPQNLSQPLLRSVQFRRQADASGWDPTPCTAVW